MAFSLEELAARKAWELPKGTHEIDTTELPGTSNLEHHPRYSVVRHSKFVLVFNDKRVIAFPKPEHIPIFMDAVNGLEPDGPGYDYPGSIGSIYAPTYNGKQCIIVVQSHYKQDSKHPIPDNLARKYSGWRKVALNDIIRLAKENKAVVQIGKKVMTPSGFNAPMRFNEVLLGEFKDIASKHGAELEDDWTSAHYRYRIDFSKKRFKKI